MRVLLIVPYITNNFIPTFSRSKGGFGYMVYDIANALASRVEVDTFVCRYRYKGFARDGITFLPSSLMLFLKYLGKTCSLYEVFKLYKKYRMSWKEVVYLLYEWFQTGYLKHVIEEGKYDIVHCHSCGFSSSLHILMFEKCNQKFVFTLHGLNSISESIHIEEPCKRYEKDFMVMVKDKKIPLTVISSGIKKRILEVLGVAMLHNIHVVTNASSLIKDNLNNLDIRKIYNIPEGGKVVLYVGNISYNKNQKQIIDAFCLMKEELRTSTYILFVGRNIEPGYNIKSLIDSNKYHSHFVLCGNVDKEIMSTYYKNADGVVLLSYEEGFGLSLIEGMQFGVPCMSHKDIYAFEDIYSPVAMVSINDRTNESVARSMEELLSKKWDREAIMKYANSFGLDLMADNYISCYNKIIYG